MHGRRQDDREVVFHGVLVTTCHFDHRHVDSKPRLWIPVSVVGFDAFRAEAARTLGSAELGREGPDAVDTDLFTFALAWGRRSGRRAPSASVVAGRSIVADAEALAFIVAPAVPLFFPLAVPPIDDVAGVAVVVDGATRIHGFLLAFTCPISAARLPARGGPTDRTGQIAFFVVLDSYCCDHRLDPSEDQRGSVVLGHHGFDGVEEL